MTKHSYSTKLEDSLHYSLFLPKKRLLWWQYRKWVGRRQKGNTRVKPKDF